MIKLDLDINEVNQILEALGQRPYKEVFQLIMKIQQQAGSQLNHEATQAPTDPNNPKTNLS